MLVVVGVVVSPLATLALHYVLWAHLLQNVALAEWAPALAVIGLPPSLAAILGRKRVLGTLTRPLVALPLWLSAYGVWHVPALYDATLRSETLHIFEHITFIAAGAVLFWPVLRDTSRFSRA